MKHFSFSLSRLEPPTCQDSASDRGCRGFTDTQCEFSCEYKYDGERAQVHLTSDGKVFIYSRNSENNTSKFPDIVEFMPSVTKPGVTAVVLDCEAVAYDREEKKILPFQVRAVASLQFSSPPFFRILADECSGNRPEN